MRVLLCHNLYQQPGGEDRSFEAEAAMLENRGHTVQRYTVHNDRIRQMSLIRIAGRTLWSIESKREIAAHIREFKPDVVHITNTFPMLSPSVYYAATQANVPVVQAVRNYRLICPAAFLMRGGQVCEDCVGRSVPWPAVRHRCYRNSRRASAVVATMLTAHRMLGTWRREVNVFYTLTDFMRNKLVEGGLPGEQIVVKPNFLDPDPGPGNGERGGAVFVGRLSSEKGIVELLDSWRHVDAPVDLRIIGDGPLATVAAQAAARDSRISVLGRLDATDVLREIGHAAVTIVPSLWYEGFPRVVIESFAKGTPVLASDLGSLAEVISPGRTGWLVPPGDSHALAVAVDEVFADGSDHLLRQPVRDEFLKNYTADTNYDQLMAIYDRARSR